MRQFAPNRDDTSAKRSDLSRTIMGPAVKGLAAVQSKVDRELTPRALMRVGDKGHQIC